MVHTEWLIEFDLVYQNDNTETKWMKMTIDSTTRTYPNEDDILKIYQNDYPELKSVVITKREQTS